MNVCRLQGLWDGALLENQQLLRQLQWHCNFHWMSSNFDISLFFFLHPTCSFSADGWFRLLNTLSNKVEGLGTCRQLAKHLGLVRGVDHDPVNVLIGRFGTDRNFPQISSELFRDWIVNTQHSYSDVERCGFLVDLMYEKLLNPDLTGFFGRLLKVSGVKRRLVTLCCFEWIAQARR